MKGVVEVNVNQVCGASGERIAGEYLKLVGYRLLDRNYRTGHLEIDIVASDRGCLVFVEVKTRKSDRFGDAFDAVKRDKISNIRKAAYSYLSNKRDNVIFNEIRIDLIAIDISACRGEMLLRHLKGVS
ncbi:MAG: YraN family protein [Candidatus Krumholzibacteriota bacterium]|nr:YraN family protein [Candidatus Krumholzibacteriota bacterium]